MDRLRYLRETEGEIGRQSNVWRGDEKERLPQINRCLMLKDSLRAAVMVFA